MVALFGVAIVNQVRHYAMISGATSGRRRHLLIVFAVRSSSLAAPNCSLVPSRNSKLRSSRNHRLIEAGVGKRGPSVFDMAVSINSGSFLKLSSLEEPYYWGFILGPLILGKLPYQAYRPYPGASCCLRLEILFCSLQRGRTLICICHLSPKGPSTQIRRSIQDHVFLCPHQEALHTLYYGTLDPQWSHMAVSISLSTRGSAQEIFALLGHNGAGKTTCMNCAPASMVDEGLPKALNQGMILSSYR